MVEVLVGEGYDISSRELTLLRQSLSLRMRESNSIRTARILEDKLDLPAQQTAEEVARQQKRRQESEWRLRTKTRRVRSKAWNGLPADPEGLTPRFPSEKTIAACKKDLDLHDNRQKYIHVRATFEEICTRNGITKKTRDMDLWEKLKADLLDAVPYLDRAYSKPPRPVKGDPLWFALDIICCDVAKKIRVVSSKMTSQQMKLALQLDPIQVVQFRTDFINILRRENFTSRFEVPINVWDRLKRTLVSESPYLQAVLPEEIWDQKDDNRVKSLEHMCRDITKRYRDKRIRAQKAREDETSKLKVEPTSDAPQISAPPFRDANSANRKIVLRYTDEGLAIVCFESDSGGPDPRYTPVTASSKNDEHLATQQEPMTDQSLFPVDGSPQTTSVYASPTNWSSNGALASAFGSAPNVVSPDDAATTTQNIPAVGKRRFKNLTGQQVKRRSGKRIKRSESQRANDTDAKDQGSQDNEKEKKHRQRRYTKRANWGILSRTNPAFGREPLLGTRQSQRDREDWYRRFEPQQVVENLQSQYSDNYMPAIDNHRTFFGRSPRHRMNPVVDNNSHVIPLAEKVDFFGQWRSPHVTPVVANDVSHATPPTSNDHLNEPDLNSLDELFSRFEHDCHHDLSSAPENAVTDRSVETLNILSPVIGGPSNHLHLSQHCAASTAASDRLNLAATDNYCDLLHSSGNSMALTAATNLLDLPAVENYDFMSYSSGHAMALSDLDLPAVENYDYLSHSFQNFTAPIATYDGFNMSANDDYNNVLYPVGSSLALGATNDSFNVPDIEDPTFFYPSENSVGLNATYNILNMPAVNGQNEQLHDLMEAPFAPQVEGENVHGQINETHDGLRDRFGYAALPVVSTADNSGFGEAGTGHINMPTLGPSVDLVPPFKPQVEPQLISTNSSMPPPGFGEDFNQFQNYFGGLYQDSTPFFLGSSDAPIEHDDEDEDGNAIQQDGEEDGEYVMDYEYPDPSEYGMC